MKLYKPWNLSPILSTAQLLKHCQSWIKSYYSSSTRKSPPRLGASEYVMLKIQYNKMPVPGWEHRSWLLVRGDCHRGIVHLKYIDTGLMQTHGSGVRTIITLDCANRASLLHNDVLLRGYLHNQININHFNKFLQVIIKHSVKWVKVKYHYNACGLQCCIIVRGSVKSIHSHVDIVDMQYCHPIHYP